MGTPLIVTLAVALLGPLLAYFATLRRLSGRIGTSEASSLWEESRSIRDWATARIAELNEIVERLQAKVEQLEKRNDSLHLENGNLARMLEEHERTIEELRNEVERLSADNDELRKENGALKGRVSELEAGT